jgi:hypothetical protein
MLYVWGSFNLGGYYVIGFSNAGTGGRRRLLIVTVEFLRGITPSGSTVPDGDWSFGVFTLLFYWFEGWLLPCTENGLWSNAGNWILMGLILKLGSYGNEGSETTWL